MNVCWESDIQTIQRLGLEASEKKRRGDKVIIVFIFEKYCIVASFGNWGA